MTGRDRDGLVVSQDLAALTALHRGLTMVDLRNQPIDPQAVAILPEHVARKYSVLPIRAGDGRLTLAMPDPTDLQLIQDLNARTGLVIEPVVATAEDVLEHLDVSYRLIENSTEESGQEARGGPPHGSRRSACATHPRRRSLTSCSSREFRTEPRTFTSPRPNRASASGFV